MYKLTFIVFLLGVFITGCRTSNSDNSELQGRANHENPRKLLSGLSGLSRYPPIFGAPWDEVLKTRYSRGNPNKESKEHTISTYGAASVRPIHKACNDLPNNIRDTIVATTKKQFPEDPWRQINYASLLIEAMFDREKLYEKWTLGTACLAHAKAFEEVVTALKIKNVSCTQMTIQTPIREGYHSGTHQVNLLNIKAKDGITYQFTHDAGWDPGIFYPRNDAAKKLRTLPKIENAQQ